MVSVAIIPALIARIIIVSSLLIKRILPNKKLKRSTENPPDELTRITPTAKPDTKTTATAESPDILVLCLNFWSPSPPNIETMKAVHNVKTPKNRPTEIPPNATCAIPSPNRE